jgi:hypothetical protein
VSVIRFELGTAFPKKYSLKGFIPALVNIRVGSFFMTMGAEGTTLCVLEAKKSKNCCLTSKDFMSNFILK